MIFNPSQEEDINYVRVGLRHTRDGDRTWLEAYDIESGKALGRQKSVTVHDSVREAATVTVELYLEAETKGMV